MTTPRGTIAEAVRQEIVVTRSRLMADVAPAESLEDANSIIAAVRKEFWDARHHCTALIIGPDGDTQRSNDDGEPGGTAGAPMLAVLRGSGLTDLVAVVTRYFGGTLLGAGGLVRAYGRAVSAALEQAPLLKRVEMVRHDVVVPVAESGRADNLLRRWLTEAGGSLDDVRYTGEDATFEVAVPADLSMVGPGHDEPPVASVLARAGLAHTVTDCGNVVRDVPARLG